MFLCKIKKINLMCKTTSHNHVEVCSKSALQCIINANLRKENTHSAKTLRRFAVKVLYGAF